MFAEQESADMEDVKIELKRKFDIKTTKQDIARAAVCELVADYKQHGEHSRLIQVLRKRAPR